MVAVLGLLVFVIGVISLFKPLRILKIKSRWVGLGLALLGLIILGASGGRQEEKVGTPTSTAARDGHEDERPRGPAFRELGRQGMVHFVVTDSLRTTAASLQDAARDICGTDDRCAVLFWYNERRAGRRLPMSTAEVNSQVAQYNINRNTGLDQLMCHPFGDPGERCTNIEGGEEQP